MKLIRLIFVYVRHISTKNCQKRSNTFYAIDIESKMIVIVKFQYDSTNYVVNRMRDKMN